MSVHSTNSLQSRIDGLQGGLEQVEVTRSQCLSTAQVNSNLASNNCGSHIQPRRLSVQGRRTGCQVFKHFLVLTQTSDNSHPIFTDSSFTNNTGYYGGAVYVDSSNPPGIIEF